MKKLMILYLSFFGILPIGFSQLGLADYGNGRYVANFPDTAIEGTSVYNYEVTVVNKSLTQNFTGTLQLQVFLDTIGDFSSPYLLDSLLLPSTTILSGDSLVITFPDSIIINTPPFKKGNGNVVVIWPISNWATLDTAFHNVYVESLTGMPLHESSYNMFFYPNPTKENSGVYVSENVMEMWIYDVTGKIYNHINVNSNYHNSYLYYDLDLPKGLYFIRFKDSNAQYFIAKLIVTTH